MEAEIASELDAKVTLDRGGGGVFKVWADGELIYDKARTGSFPKPGEVPRLVKGRL